MASRGIDLMRGAVTDITSALVLEDGTRYTLTCANDTVRYAEVDDTDPAPTVDFPDYNELYPHNDALPPFPRSVTPENGTTIYAWPPLGDARLSVVEG